MGVTVDGSSIRKSSVGRLFFITTILMFVCAAAAIVIGDSDDSDASSTFTVDGVKYTTTFDNMVEVVPNSYSGSVTIPSTVTHSNITYSVTSIGNNTFYGCTSLTSVTIPDSVTSIGQYAFKGCTSLTSVIIGNSVTSINYQAFYGCTSLTFVTNNSFLNITKGSTSYGYVAYYAKMVLGQVLDYSVGDIKGKYNNNSKIATVTGYNGAPTSLILDKLTVGDIECDIVGINSAFINCTSLTSVIIGNSVTSISYQAFYGCTSLTSVTIPDSVTSIDQYAFSGCTSLTSVIIGNSITSIDQYAFSGCTSLTSVTIPDSVTSIDQYAFSGCTSLTSVIIGNSVTSIDQYAFSGCTSLTSVTIGNGVTSIGNNAFNGCTSLTSVTVPDSVTSIGYQAFYGCTSLTSVTIGNGVTSIGNNAFNGCTSLTSVINNSFLNITKGSTSYGYVAYYADAVIGQILDYSVGDIKGKYNNNSKIATVTGYNGVPTSLILDKLTVGDIECDIVGIGNIAFNGCTSLTSVTIPDSVIYIGDNAFNGCTSLTSVTIGNGVTSIGNNAFNGCTSLTSVTIGNSVISIGQYAFYECYSLIEVCNDSSLPITGGFTDCGYVAYYALNVYSSDSGSSYLHYQILDDSSIAAYYQKDYVTYLVKIKNMKGVIALPDTLGGRSYSVYRYAFYGCTSLTSVTIGNGVTSIYQYAFYGCTSLTSFTIPNGVTSIGDNAFYGCTSLTSVTIGNGVTSIGDYAFYNCTSLTKIDFNAISCNSLHYKFIGINSTFHNAGALGTGITVVFGNTVTKIPAYLFYSESSDSPKITTVFIGDNVTSIDQYAFYRCTHLTSVTIPDSVTSIGDNAFYGCTSLTSFTIPNGVTSIGDNAFSGCNEMKFLYMHSCTLTSSYSLEKGLEKISIDKGTKGLSTFLANYEFCTSEGLSLNKTMLSGYVYESNDEGAMVRTGKVTNTYVVSFTNDDDVLLTSDYEYGETIVVPTETPVKQSTAQYFYTFDHWDGFIEGMTVTGDQTFNAVFNEIVRSYKQTFINMNSTFYEYNAPYDSIMSKPDTNPTRPSDGNCEYKFVSWNGYSDGMKVTGDMTFTSSFEAVVKDVDISGDKVTIDTKTVSDVKVSSTIVDSIRSAGKDGKSTDISMLNGTISIDSASAAGLPEGEQTILFTEADRTKIPAGIADEIGTRPVYSISIGNIHNFNGTLTISVKYDLQNGEKAEDVCIWYLKDNGSYERIACTYVNGYATFTTNHLSDYAVVVESDSAPSDTSSNGGSGLNIGVTIGIAVAAIVVIALIAVFVIKGKKRSEGQ